MIPTRDSSALDDETYRKDQGYLGATGPRCPHATSARCRRWHFLDEATRPCDRDQHLLESGTATITLHRAGRESQEADGVYIGCSTPLMT